MDHYNCPTLSLCHWWSWARYYRTFFEPLSILSDFEDKSQ